MCRNRKSSIITQSISITRINYFTWYFTSHNLIHTLFYYLLYVNNGILTINDTLLYFNIENIYELFYKKEMMSNESKITYLIHRYGQAVLYCSTFKLLDTFQEP